MKLTANNITRYIKLFVHLLKINYSKAMEYRIDFFSTILPTGIYSLGYLVFINTLLSKVPSISGWNFDQMLILFATEQLFYYSGWIFYRSSIDNFPQLIKDGTFDFVSRLPVSARFMVSFREQSLDVLIPFAFAVTVLVYSLRNIHVELSSAILFVLFIIFGMILLYNILFSLASLSFWTTEADEFINLVDEILSFGRYPLEIFPGLVGVFLLFIIPAILMAYVPATILLGIVDWKLALLSIVMVFISFIISEKIWRAGLRHYSSASS